MDRLIGAIVSAAVIAAVAFALGWMVQGWRKEALIESMRTEQSGAMAAAIKQARNDELQAATDLLAINNELESQLDSEQKKSVDLQQRAAAGDIRLSVPARQCSSPAPANAGASAQSPGPSRADLLPATAAAIVGLAIECDEVVRERNAAVDIYNAVREHYNGIEGTE